MFDENRFFEIGALNPYGGTMGEGQTDRGSILVCGSITVDWETKESWVHKGYANS